MKDQERQQTAAMAEAAATFSAVAKKQAQEQEGERQRGRKTKITPHERGRTARLVAVTFPSPGWKDAIKEQASDWGIGQSDFVTLCVSYTMAAIERGDLRRPAGDRKEHSQRAGTFFYLPWEPDKLPGEAITGEGIG